MGFDPKRYPVNRGCDMVCKVGRVTFEKLRLNIKSRIFQLARAQRAERQYLYRIWHIPGKNNVRENILSRWVQVPAISMRVLAVYAPKLSK